MRTSSRYRGLLAVLVALGLVACTSSRNGGTASSTSEAPATTASTTSTASTTPTASGSSANCAGEQTAMLDIVDGWIAEAGLAPGEWVDPATETPFDDRTYPAEEFADHVGMPCDLRAVQVTDAGDTRLVLASWVLPRYGFVVQATDGPRDPYAPQVTFDLLLEQPRGEWIAEQKVWAGTMEGSETVLVGAEDFAPGAVATSWQSAFPPLPDAEVTLASERIGIDALREIGATNVGVAQPPEYGSQVGTLMAVTAAGQIILAYVGPPDEIGIEDPWLRGESSTEVIGGATVLVTLPSEGDFDVADVRFACGAVDVRLSSTFGTADDLVGVAGDLIAALDCETGVAALPRADA